MSFVDNIETVALENSFYRSVVYTGDKMQLVVMCIPRGQDIGEEVHARVEQMLVFVEGRGVAIVDNEQIEVGPGSTVFVTPGTRHNFINAGSKPLRLFTVYSPPNHIDGTVHPTKADAEADLEDERFGQTVGRRRT
jgi:mannose-6-phosphate isomerase-like protein (cupin superfamily)